MYAFMGCLFAYNNIKILNEVKFYTLDIYRMTETVGGEWFRKADSYYELRGINISTKTKFNGPQRCKKLDLELFGRHNRKTVSVCPGGQLHYIESFTNLQLCGQQSNSEHLSAAGSKYMSGHTRRQVGLDLTSVLLARLTACSWR